MPQYTLQITAEGENGEEIQTTVEKDAHSAENAKQDYLNTVNKIVEYWDIAVERVSKL